MWRGFRAGELRIRGVAPQDGRSSKPESQAITLIYTDLATYHGFPSVPGLNLRWSTTVILSSARCDYRTPK